MFVFCFTAEQESGITNVKYKISCNSKKTIAYQRHSASAKQERESN